MPQVNVVAVKASVYKLNKGFQTMEQTLSIIKPDGVKKNVIGEIYKRFEQAGLKIIQSSNDPSHH